MKNCLLSLLFGILFLNLNAQELASYSPYESKSDKIVGKYYVDFFYNYLKNGFELKREKAKDSFILYTFEFKNNGELIFNDLTEFYGCGNGVLSIKKGKWKAKGNGIYELIFDGEYALDFKFHAEIEYRLIDLENGNLNMKLNEVLVYEKAGYEYN